MENNKGIITRSFRAAFPCTIPILAGFLFLGMAYGIYMNVSGFSFVYPMIMAAVIFGGRLPTGDEMREIARNVDRICVSLAAVGEGPLYRGPYLITDDPGPYGALTMDIEAPDKIEPVDFDEGCSFIVVK